MRVVSLGLALAILFLGFSTEAPAKFKETHPIHEFHGIVTHVHHKDGGHGVLTVKHHHHGVKSDGDKVDVNVEKKFHVHGSTTIEKVHEHKGKKEVTGSSFAHVHKGEHVIIHYKNHNSIGKHEHVAIDVKILHRK